MLEAAAQKKSTGNIFLHQEPKERSMRDNPDQGLVNLAVSSEKQVCVERKFQSLAQWSVVYDRWSLAAVATEQVTWAFVMTHRTTVMKITDEQRQKKESVELARCYDKCARVLWARMKKQEAEGFDLMKAADAPGDLFLVVEANLQIRVAGEAIF